jgi:hypothetical protein
MRIIHYLRKTLSLGTAARSGNASGRFTPLNIVQYRHICVLLALDLVEC